MVVINHLTRMREGSICVAGLDVRTGQHVRPVLPGIPLGSNLLRRDGGPFDIGAIVDLGPVRAGGSPPEIEDQVFDLRRAKYVRTENAVPFWKRLIQCSRPSLAAIFGPALYQDGSSCVAAKGTGAASLGCFQPPTAPSFHLVREDKVRLRISDGSFDVYASVTDLRLYDRRPPTALSETIKDIEGRVKQGVKMILCVGLTRPWSKSENEPRRHWLQVNNIHLEDSPIWQLR
jgi:hypothetical protein